MRCDCLLANLCERLRTQRLLLVMLALSWLSAAHGSAGTPTSVTLSNEHLRLTFDPERKALTELAAGPGRINTLRPGSVLLGIDGRALTQFDHVTARVEGRRMEISFSDRMAAVQGTVELTLQPGDRHVTATAKVANKAARRDLEVVFPDMLFAFAREDTWCFEPFHTGRLRPLAKPHFAPYINPIRVENDPKRGGFWIYGYEGADQIAFPGTALINPRGNVGIAALDWNHFTLPFGVECAGEATRVRFVQNRKDYFFLPDETRSFGCVIGSDERDWHYSLRPYRDWLAKTYGQKRRPSWWHDLDPTGVNNAYFGMLFGLRMEGVQGSQSKMQPEPHRLVHESGLVPKGGRYEDALAKIVPNVEQTNARILLFHQWWDFEEQGPMHSLKKGPIPAAGGYHASRLAGGYESLGKLFGGLKKLGLHIMPYFHSITFWKNGPYGMDWSLARVVKAPDGEPILCSAWPSGLLSRQSQEPLFFRWLPCPGEQGWIDFLCQRSREVMLKSGADCLCYDQVGAARHSTCFNPAHDHRFADAWGAGRMRLMQALAGNAIATNPDTYIYVELLHLKRHRFCDTCAVHEQAVEKEQSWKTDWDRGHTRAIDPEVQICYSPAREETADAVLAAGLGYNEYRRPWSHQRSNTYVRELFLEAFLDDVCIAPSLGEFKAEMGIVHRHFRGNGRELLAFYAPWADWRGAAGVWASHCPDPALIEYPSGHVIAPTRSDATRLYFPIELRQKTPKFYVFQRELLRGLECPDCRAAVSTADATRRAVQLAIELVAQRDTQVEYEVRIPGGLARKKGTWDLKSGRNSMTVVVSPQPIVCPGERQLMLRISRDGAQRCWFFPVTL